MKYTFSVKIRCRKFKKTLYRKRLKANTFTRALEKAIHSMTTKGRLKKGRLQPISRRDNNLWYIWMRSENLEVTIKRLEKERK